MPDESHQHCVQYKVFVTWILSMFGSTFALWGYLIVSSGSALSIHKAEDQHFNPETHKQELVTAIDRHMLNALHVKPDILNEKTSQAIAQHRRYDTHPNDTSKDQFQEFQKAQKRRDETYKEQLGDLRDDLRRRDEKFLDELKKMH